MGDDFDSQDEGKASNEAFLQQSHQQHHTRKRQGSGHNLSYRGEAEEEVPPQILPWLVTEWLQCEAEKLAVPQYYHFWGPRVGVARGCPSALPLSGPD